MSKILIRFDGLCTFAAKNPPHQNGQNMPAADESNEMFVLLVDARHHPLMAHRPEISIKTGNVTDCSEDMNENQWQLDQEHVDLLLVDAAGNESPPGSDSLRIVRDQRVYFDETGEPANAFPADAEEAEDFSWIPSISQIDPDRRIDPDLLEPVVTQDSLVGRLHLTQGTLKVSSFVQEPGVQAGMAAYEFRNGRGRMGTLRQALAEGVTAEIDLPAETQIKVRVRKLADPTLERWVTLAPASTEGDIEMEFANRPLGSVDIGHFAMFYRLTRGNGQGGPIPSISRTNRRIARRRGMPVPKEFEARALAFSNPDACPFVQGP